MSDAEKNGFYIGYLPRMPESYRGRVRGVVLIIGAVLVLCAAVIGYYQRPFNAGNFEFGSLTRVTGVLYKMPVPRIVTNYGEERSSILLVGFGKMGALSTVEAMENDLGDGLDSREVTIEGTLIYGEGKVLMELTNHEKSLVEAKANWTDSKGERRVGDVQIIGEIVDPKCYFGVMKPGEGKTHRACAVRCVAGGIPPVLKVTGAQGHPEFYLLRGPNKERINSDLLPFIGDRIEVTGSRFVADDWDILNIDPATILRVNP